MDQQPYDSSLKALFQEDAEELIPLFVPGAKFVELCDSEIIRPTKRLDRPYRVDYRDQPHTFDFEFETGSDSDMALRLLVYHALLLERYRLPVISIIVYPFRTTVAVSPFQEMSGSEELLRFPFRKFTLWTERAEQYMKGHALSMYPLLPTMQGATDTLLLQAIEELRNHYKDRESTLARRLLWMSVFLRRANILPPQDKYRVQERLKMYDNLLEQDPYVQNQRALGEIKGRVEGKAEGELQAYRAMVVHAVSSRFPALVELAQQRVARIDSADLLRGLIDLVYTAPDENTARWLLSPGIS